MKKGAQLLALLRDQYYISDIFNFIKDVANDGQSNDNEKVKIDENQINNSQHIDQFTESQIILQQNTPQKNYKKKQLGLDHSSLIIGESQNNYHNSSTHHHFDSPQGNSLLDEMLSQDGIKDQILSESSSSQKNKKECQNLQSRSKSLFFQQNKSDQSPESQKKSVSQSEKTYSKESKTSKEEKYDDHNIFEDDKSDKDEQQTKRDSNANILNSNLNSENFISYKSPRDIQLSSRPFVQTIQSKLFSSNSSNSISQNLQIDTQTSNRKAYFSFRKSEKVINEQPKRFDHRKRSFIFTNFIKHAEDTDSEDKSMSATNPKVTPIKINPTNTINFEQTSFSNINNQLQKTKKPKKQGWNFAVQLKNINRFISKMRDQTSESNFSKLQPHHLNMINDRSFQSEGGSSQFFSHYEKNQNNNFLNKIPIFSPDETLLITFKVCVILALIIEIFILPVEVGFQIDAYTSQGNASSFLRIIPALLFVIDFHCRMNTGYYQNGTFVEKRKEIIHYYKSMLILDLINIITLNFRITFSTPFQILVFLIRIIILAKKCQDISDNFSFLERYPSAYNLTKLAFILLIVGHVCGCGFHYITTIEVSEHSSTNWVKFYNFDQLNIQNRYIISIYYATITMITVGYGDITPQNQVERIYVICIVIISGTVFAYAVNMIGAIFQEKEKKIADYKYIIILNFKFEFIYILKLKISKYKIDVPNTIERKK